ncbi:MAG TPA: VOC family protein [Candidatus Binatia bacterium]|jgi:catechol 2,3-dioxygenase-like lactoylglutathione lyase family enzyme
MAQIKHIAIRTHDVAKTAAFYKEAFDLEQVGVAQNGIYLTDGHLNIAILSLRTPADGETMKIGVDHIGFAVNDVNAAVARVKSVGGKALDEHNVVDRANTSKAQSYFEVKCVGPDGQVIDVSNAGWIGAK